MKFQPIAPMIWTSELEVTISLLLRNLGFSFGQLQ